ncbi:P-loop NTPase [soil metagenome]|uniref:Mrp/NBP35 family ATP-binding protein n=1 Tax=Microbacterium sp. TaxID=51671 RepID=UPI0025FBB9E2|nr:Mrp/NBP35 family ATP-binding protein [Microbacterium sp.]
MTAHIEDAAIVDTPADAVRRAVGAVIDPELRRPIAELGMMREVRVERGLASVGIVLTIVGCPAADRISADVRAAAASVPGVTRVALEVGVMSPAERRVLTERLRGGRPAREMPFGPDSLTRVIAVTSGKGGVGKSTVTANLAVALANRGLSVGLVDADVHGFSIPGLLGLVDADGNVPQPTRIDELMLPPVAHGVKVISIGMFLRRSTGDAPIGAVAWRGPMLHRTVQQFLTDVFFGDLDVLLLDMPPGTGDIAISVGQLLPHAEVVVVTTPQSAASDVAVRSGLVARQTGQRVVGVVENMAAMTLPDGTTLDLFGTGGGAAVAAALSTGESKVALLTSIPLSPLLRVDADAGIPIVLAHPDEPAAVAIVTLADRLAAAPRGLAGRSLPFRPS